MFSDSFPQHHYHSHHLNREERLKKASRWPRLLTCSTVVRGAATANGGSKAVLCVRATVGLNPASASENGEECVNTQWGRS